MSLADLWQDIRPEGNNDNAADAERAREVVDPAATMKRKLQTEAARRARAVGRARSKEAVVEALPLPVINEDFATRLQREHLTSEGYAASRKHEYDAVDTRHTRARERSRCIKSFLETVAKAVTYLFRGDGQPQSGSAGEVQHALNTVISDDTSTRLRSHRNDKADVFTIMNTSQALFCRYGNADYESLFMPTPLQILPSGKAGSIHAAFRAWLAVSASGLGSRLVLLQCRSTPPRHATFVLMGDALKANDAAWRLEKAMLLAERAKANPADPPHRTYGVRMKCSNHQISLARKPLVLSFEQFWPTLVRLGHLFETSAALINLCQSGGGFQRCLSHHILPCVVFCCERLR